MVYAEFGGQTECIIGNWKIENGLKKFGRIHEGLFSQENRWRFSPGGHKIYSGRNNEVTVLPKWP